MQLSKAWPFCLLAIFLATIVGAVTLETARIDPTSPADDDDLIGYCNASDSNGAHIKYNYSFFKNDVLNSSDSTPFTGNDSFYTSGTSTGRSFYGIFWDGMTFTTTRSLFVTKFEVELAKYNSGDGQEGWFLIYQTSSGLPTGSPILNETINVSVLPVRGGDFARTNLSVSGVWLEADVLYAFVFANINGNSTMAITPQVSGPGNYAGGNYFFSNNGGSSWSPGSTEWTFALYTDRSNESIEVNVANVSNTLTTIGDNWTIQCQGFNGTSYGAALNSTSVQITEATDLCTYSSGNWVVNDTSNCTTGYSVTGNITFSGGSALSVSGGSNVTAAGG